MVSIVIPVYNAGSLLKESVTSLINQTYRDFELICVNDCSYDTETISLLSEYAYTDKRIRVINLEKNVGAAEARNIGMCAAIGEYIIFLDADDVFDREMIEKMYQCISKNDADICVCGHRNFSDLEKRVISFSHPVQKDGITDRVFDINELPEEALRCWSSAPWNKMCKREFLLNEDIYFQSLKSSNDVFFSYMCSLCAKRIVYCENGRDLLSYRTNNQYQISANRNPIYFFKAIEELSNKKRNIAVTQKKKILYALMMGTIWELKVCGDSSKKKECYRIVQDYLRDKSINLEFDSEIANRVLGYFLEEEYESEWFIYRGDFYSQIKNKSEQIRNIIYKYDDIVVWGAGKRGNALQKWLLENKEKKVVITDRTNENKGQKTIYGYQVIDTEEALKTSGLIIATNAKIYSFLKKIKDLKETSIINLEEYCPYE